MTIEQAKNIRIEEYLQRCAITPVKAQGNNLWYLSPLRAENEPSFKVNQSRNEWYDFGAGVGGDIVKLVMELHRTADIGEALQIIAEKPISPGSFSFRQQEHFESFEDISVKPLANAALLQFLNERQIPALLAEKYCKEVYYKHNDKPYFAIAFGNESGGYEIRNKYFKGCISPKDITVVANNCTACIVFEGFTDMLSFLTLCNRKSIDTAKYDYLVMNSVAKIGKAIPILSKYETLHCYLDNDTAGQNASTELRKSFGNRLTDHSVHYREYKDLNDYLCGKKLVQEIKQSNIPKSRKMKL